MCERQYTNPAIAEMQAIAVLAELRRRLQERIAHRSALQPLVREAELYNVGLLDGLAIVAMALDELAPDYSQCDNPPTEEEE